MMEDKIYKVTVERLNRLQMILLLWGMIFIAYSISWVLETKLGIVVRGELIMLGMLVLLCFCVVKLERFFPAVEEIEAAFRKDEVVFRKGRRERRISYANIREVEKIMVITRYHSEKGFYRIKVKKSGMAYILYSGEDGNKQLDFEETGLSKVYYEFKSRGVKCC